MTRILKNKKGVTLVELLAVIVILGIIAAIAVPTIGGLINRQKENAAQATLESIEFAAVSFADGDNTLVFTLQDLEDDEFVDLKDNDYAVVAAGGTAPAAEGTTLTTAIFISVDAGVVSFWLDVAKVGAADFYVELFLVVPTT